MSDDDLGGQTATVQEREPAANREYRKVGAPTSHQGCSLQADPSGGERVTDGRTRQQRRWKLFAPAGFRASSHAQCTVTPGPTDDAGAPLVLSFDGAPEAHWDLDGTEDHVTAILVS